MVVQVRHLKTAGWVSDAEQVRRVQVFRAALCEMPEDFQADFAELRRILASWIWERTDLKSMVLAELRADCILAALVWEGRL